jgi:hypothetical protein
MASAEMEKEIENRVSDLVNREFVKMENETGLNPHLTYAEAQQYLGDVLKELKRNRS